MGSSWIRALGGAIVALGLAAGLVGCDRRGDSAAAPEVLQPQLIARADLFGDPARHGARLSPRGDRVAFLAPRDGVTNLWVLSVDAMDQARPVTDDRDRAIQSFAWAADGTTLLYLQDDRGDENWRLFAVAAAGGEPRALTPAGVRAQILALGASDPGGVLITLNQRDPEWPDVIRIDIASGRRTVVERNAGRFVSFVADTANKVRLGRRALPDGGAEIMRRSGDGVWSSVLTIPFEDAATSRAIAVEEAGSFLMFDSTGRDRAALVRVDLETGAKTVLGESARGDVAEVWLNPMSNAPEAYGSEYLRLEWRAIDPEAQADLEFLNGQLSGNFSVASRSADDGRWIVVEEGPTTPARSYLYDRSDRAHRRLSLLFRHRPALEQAPLQPMTPVEIEARDGLTLVSYLTLPIGSDANGDARPETPRPLVIMPHGGPWERDSYGFSAVHQWLANRGYAVLSVNFRGSTGFGKAFLNAGNREWGARMQEDLLDAVQWAVANGVARADRIAIAGAGFGGYAALAGLAFAPAPYRCGASYGAPVDLSAMLAGMPAAAREEAYLRVGDARAAAGRRMLREQSPLFRAAQIRQPLFLSLGARAATRAPSDQIAQSLRARGIGLTYLVFPDEGRTLVRTQNRLAFLAVLEHFLGDCLGGREEPVGAAFEGANIEVYDGAVNVPGLSAFARRARAPVAAPGVPNVDADAEDVHVEPSVGEISPP